MHTNEILYTEQKFKQVTLVYIKQLQLTEKIYSLKPKLTKSV